MSGEEIINTGSEETLWYRSAMYPIRPPVSVEVIDKHRIPVVREGVPLEDISPTGMMYYQVYDALFSRLGLASRGFNVHRAVGDAFTGMNFPSIVRMPEGLSGEALYREVLRQMTPVMEFDHEDLDAYSGWKRDKYYQEAKYGDLGRAWTILHAASHEFAHATMQLGLQLSPSDVRRHMEGELDLEVFGPQFGAWQQAKRELYSDVFAAAVSLDPKIWVITRYSMAVQPKTKHTPYYVRTYSWGDPIEMRVFSPSIIDDPDSPLYRQVARNIQDLMESIDSPVTEDDEQLSTLYEYSKEDVSKFKEPRYVSRFGTVLGGFFTSSFNNVGWSRLMEENQDVADLIGHTYRRTWGIPYVVGKARPDLIGKRITITPEGDVIDPQGTKIDLAEILPDLPLTGNLEPDEVHPVLLERGFQVQEVYNRARQALQQGYRFEPPPIQAADVVNTWRQEFERIVR